GRCPPGCRWGWEPDITCLTWAASFGAVIEKFFPFTECSGTGRAGPPARAAPAAPPPPGPGGAGSPAGGRQIAAAWAPDRSPPGRQTGRPAAPGGSTGQISPRSAEAGP